MNIKILGSGCKKCLALEENVKAAIDRIGVEAQIEKITDVVEIAQFGVMSTPGLVINDQVVSTGKLLNEDQIAEKLSKVGKD